MTFYDASCIQVALNNKMVLVTNEEKPLKIGGKYIKAISSRDI
ncbi:MAG: hypothetical protein QW638_07790 [Candidatus Bathyarchaeia archaeon]